MTDAPPPPGEPADTRNERLAARLRTEPLDDVTRARLVRNAMAASTPDAASQAGREHRMSTRTRWMAVAAVVVALVAAGVAVLARDDTGAGPTAAPAPKAAESHASPAERAPLPADSSGLPSISREAGVQNLGNLGDVGKKSELRGAVADVLSSREPPAEAQRPTAGAATASPPLSSAGDCASDELARLGRTIAIGTGTVDGAPVTVYVVERSNGDRVAVVVDAGCNAGAPIGL